MDLRTTSTPPSELEAEAVDAVLGPPPTGWVGGARNTLDGHVAFGGLRHQEATRHLLLPVLHSLQERVGHVSHPALDYACTRLDVAPAEAFGVASAYALLSLEERPSLILHLCDDIACHAASGGDPCVDVLEALGPAGEARAGVVWERSACLGHCEHGSAAMVQQSGADRGRASMAPVAAGELSELGAPVDLGSLPLPELLVPQTASSSASLRLLKRVTRVDPSSIDSYRAMGGYEALRVALRLGPSGVISEVKDARLLGRGGAAFPTGTKWEAVSRNPDRPHYFVVNADESEPGTFKDKVLMENDPFALVEAATIAGLATGSEKGFVYLRGEYPLAEARLSEAISQARARGYLGADIGGSGSTFDLEIRRGAGAYIAGEETALFNSLEGRRPEPRNKPPYPTDRGLFGKPTGVNNVETLLNVLEILVSGAQAYAATGTPSSTGTRLFCVSGAIERPGLYELPMGTPLRHLLELAGGVREGRSLTAILLGGAAGSFVTARDLDLPLSFEGAREAGTTLGSGVVLVIDDSVDLKAILRRIARFFRDESCGQCVPCRVGTVRQEELVARLCNGVSETALELDLLADLGTVMRDASICGLGQTASSAIESAVRLGLVANGREPS
jgi:NADH-quinone oxidoreductase subunit F